MEAARPQGREWDGNGRPSREGEWHVRTHEMAGHMGHLGKTSSTSNFPIHLPWCSLQLPGSLQFENLQRSQIAL